MLSRDRGLVAPDLRSLQPDCRASWGNRYWVIEPARHPSLACPGITQHPRGSPRQGNAGILCQGALKGPHAQRGQRPQSTQTAHFGQIRRIRTIFTICPNFSIRTFRSSFSIFSFYPQHARSRSDTGRYANSWAKCVVLYHLSTRFPKCPICPICSGVRNVRIVRAWATWAETRKRPQPGRNVQVGAFARLTAVCANWYGSGPIDP